MSGLLGIDGWIYGLSFAPVYVCVCGCVSLHGNTTPVSAIGLRSQGSRDASDSMASLFSLVYILSSGLKPSVCCVLLVFIFVLTCSDSCKYNRCAACLVYQFSKLLWSAACCHVFWVDCMCQYTQYIDIKSYCDVRLDTVSFGILW